MSNSNIGQDQNYVCDVFLKSVDSDFEADQEHIDFDAARGASQSLGAMKQRRKFDVNQNLNE